MLEKQISKDYITAVKARDSIKSSTLNFLRSQLKYLIIDKKVDKLPDQDVIVVIKKQIKQRKDSIDQYTSGGRKDLADKESAELKILESYLPAEMPMDQLAQIVEETIKETGAQSAKDMGAVMKALMLKVAGKADSKSVSDIVKAKLSQA
jgi:uncharacterized protein YqeY